MNEQEQINQLKAQVNCLRKAALDAISYMTGGEAKANLRDAYDATPEQCLAEVKAKAIEEYKQEQAEMKQMELASEYGDGTYQPLYTAPPTREPLSDDEMPVGRMAVNGVMLSPDCTTAFILGVRFAEHKHGIGEK